MTSIIKTHIYIYILKDSSIYKHRKYFHVLFLIMIQNYSCKTQNEVVIENIYPFKNQTKVIEFLSQQFYKRRQLREINFNLQAVPN